MIRVDDEIALVPLHADVADAYAAHAERDYERMRRWLWWVDRGRSADDVRAFVATVEERRLQGLGDCYTIVVDGEVAGAVDIHDVNHEHGVGAMGYWLGSTSGGRGIMTRAVVATAQLAFGTHGLHRLELLAAVDNHASRAVAERAGFTLEAILRQRLWAPYGFDDAALYAKLAP